MTELVAEAQVESDIDIEVETAFVPEHSNHNSDEYMFTYTVTLRNDSYQAMRIVRRFWIVTNADGESEELQAEGVGDEYPQLKPGEQFRYTAGIVLSTPFGSMYGGFILISDTGVQQYAMVEPLTFAVPNMIN